ncbi:hypothetical protein [Aliiroseovarius sp.]|uniref:hypothetical protein n=1 Tax=Aliiroseovarius sp. TaxID=1872442 RepID=UPI003BAC0AD7
MTSETQELEIFLGCPRKVGGEFHTLVYVPGVLEGKPIIAEDPLSSLAQALNLLQSILDPPIPLIAQQMGDQYAAFSLQSAKLVFTP